MSGPQFDLVLHKLGTVLVVRVSPGASRDRIAGRYGGGLKVAVSAPPEKGKANQSLVKLLAKATGLDRRSISVVAGETSKSKKILFEGIKPDSLLEILERIVEK